MKVLPSVSVLELTLSNICINDFGTKIRSMLKIFDNFLRHLNTEVGEPGYQKIWKTLSFKVIEMG